MKSHVSTRYSFLACIVVSVAVALMLGSASLNAGSRHPLRQYNGHRSLATSHQSVKIYECDFVDVPPEFPGGDYGLMKYINSTRLYPEQAYRNRVEGRVLCSFIIMPDGSVDVSRCFAESSRLSIVRRYASSQRCRDGKPAASAMSRWLCAIFSPYTSVGDLTALPPVSRA